MFIEYLPHMACLFGGALIGAGVIAWCAVSSVSDAQREADEQRDEAAAQRAIADLNRAAYNTRITTLTDIARNQKSIKSGRILDVLEG